MWQKFLDDYSRFEDWLKTSERTAALPNSSGVLYTVAKEELKKFEVCLFQVKIKTELNVLSCFKWDVFICACFDVLQISCQTFLHVTKYLFILRLSLQGSGNRKKREKSVMLLKLVCTGLLSCCSLSLCTCTFLLADCLAWTSGICTLCA